MARAQDDARWLLLIHQIPPKPAYFRQRVGRRLHRLGAVAIKNSVYVLPMTEQTQEDFQWVAREIAADGGEATLCRASFVEGLRDDQIEALFHAARDADYEQIAEGSRELVSDLPPRLGRDDERRPALEADLARLRKRLAEVLAIDFFGSSGRVSAEATIGALERRLREAPKGPVAPAKPRKADHQGRTWVTRKNIHVDRIASAWLIRRFIDPKPTFKFVPGQGYKARDRELTFDMFEATFTHVADRCTFEVLVDEFSLREPGLGPIAEIVHDIDVKDGKFGRPEAAGIASLIAGIALTHRDDARRIEVGSLVLDALVELYGRRGT